MPELLNPPAEGDIASEDIAFSKFNHELASIAVTVAVQDGDGNEVCYFVAKAAAGAPVTKVRTVLDGLVKQWANMHDAVIERVESRNFGNLPVHDIKCLDVLAGTGALLLLALKEVQRRTPTDAVIDQHIIDLQHTLAALALLRSSYEGNVTNEALDCLAEAMD